VASRTTKSDERLRALLETAIAACPAPMLTRTRTEHTPEAAEAS
jgi:hypothetical protein